MKYGRQVVMNLNGDLVTTTEQVYANYTTVKEVTMFHEIVRVDDDKDVLAIFLKLLDKQKSGEIDCIGVQVLRNPSNRSMRVEKSWVSPDLQ